MARKPQHIDHLLRDWEYEAGQPVVRRAQGADGREILQMRVDMGVLQMETRHRPDGQRPGGCDTYYDYLVATAFEEGADFALDQGRCTEIDREFYQFYHRRICWLALKEYGRAVDDADHTLSLMDFSSANSPDADWALMHEQYRPFVLFHRIQASALIHLEANQAPKAVERIDAGLEDLGKVFADHDVEDRFDEDAFVIKLREMRDAIVDHYELGPSLAEQLAEAIAAEHYELAAELRDQIGADQSGGGKN